MLRCVNLIEIRFYAYLYASSFLVLWHIIFHSLLLRLIPYLHQTSSVLRPLELLSEIFNEGGIKIISLTNIRPIIIYFHSSQCRLILYLHQRPIFFKANSFIVVILELIRGAQFLIEVIRSSGEEMWRISNTVLQPRDWGSKADSPEVCRLFFPHTYCWGVTCL